jgi:hypothetical protein
VSLAGESLTRELMDGGGREPLWVAADIMSLIAVGSEMRRSLVLVIHDVSQPWATMVSSARR